MKTKASPNFKIKYSKDGKKPIHINGQYSKNDYWTIILDDMKSLRELGDLITAVRADILDDYEEVFQLHSGE